MSRRAADRDDVARRHLDRLAGEVRRVGLGTGTPVERHTLPGLVVTADGASVLILAGYAHFWRYGPDGELRKVGPFTDLAATAREVREHLMDVASRRAGPGRDPSGHR